MVEYGPRWIYHPAVNYGQILIKIIVGTGDNKKIFMVHKNLLCAVSDYFEARLNCPSCTESQKMTVTLKDEQPSIFEVLQRWVYSGEVEDAGFYPRGNDYPAHRRGSFAVEYGLDLDSLRREANDRALMDPTYAADRDVMKQPDLGTSCLIAMLGSDTN